MKKHYILRLDSYEGDGSSLMVNADGSDCMYVVLVVEDQSADIVDWEYASVDELLEAWKNVEFENLKEFE